MSAPSNNLALPWEFLNPENDAYCYVFDANNEQVLRLPSRSGSIAQHIVACVNNNYETLKMLGRYDTAVLQRVDTHFRLTPFDPTESEGGHHD